MTCTVCGCDLPAGRTIVCTLKVCQNKHYRRPVERTCSVCGKSWSTLRKAAKFCSDECKSQAYRGTVKPPGFTPSRMHQAKLRLKRAARGRRDYRTSVAGPCFRCGVPFVSKFHPGAPGYCSDACFTADKRDRRRARQAGADITMARRIDVFERDSWTCRICGDEVNRLAKVPELDAPTIDHTIPLAAGGCHSFDNWQTAHFYCNSVKRDQLAV